MCTVGICRVHPTSFFRNTRPPFSFTVVSGTVTQAARKRRHQKLGCRSGPKSLNVTSCETGERKPRCEKWVGKLSLCGSARPKMLPRWPRPCHRRSAMTKQTSLAHLSVPEIAVCVLFTPSPSRTILAKPTWTGNNSSKYNANKSSELRRVAGAGD